MKANLAIPGCKRSLELEYEIAKEVPLSLFINGSHYATAMISPEMRKEFVVGHLFSEGIIDSLEDIQSMKIEDNVAKVITNNKFKTFAATKVILSGCGGASNFTDGFKLPKVNSVLKVNKDTIIHGVREILKSESYKRTRGVHKCAIFNQSLLTSAEDIGRHNALDKVIGYALMRKCSLRDTFITITGRISSEMALKCSRSNIPIIASKTSVTSLAVDIANKTGLTIIGFVTGKKMNIYTNAQRIKDV